MINYIHIIAYLLGVAFSFLMRMRSLTSYFKAAGQDFVFQKFWRCDRIVVLSAIIFLPILIIILPEIIAFEPRVNTYIRLLFTVSGALGEYAFSQFLGGSRKYIKSVIKEKIDNNSTYEGNADALPL